MADLADERIRFYLRHRDQIEKWASLRSEAALALDALLERLKDDVRTLAGQLSPDIDLKHRIEPKEAYPHFLLHRTSWGLSPDDPEATVALEWARGKTFLDGLASPYVGIRVAISDDASRQFRNEISRAVQEIRATRGDKTDTWWSSIRYVPAAPGFWEDFGRYRAQLLSEIRDAWMAYAGPLEKVILTSRGMG